MKWCPYIKKKFGKILHIYDPIFCQNYYVVLTPNEQDFLAIIKKQLSIILEPRELTDGRFVVIEKHKTPIGLIWSKDTKYNLLHECFHAVSWTLRHKGILLTDDTDDVYAYVIQFLVRAILEK